MVVVFTLCLALMGVFFFILINTYRLSLEKRQKEALRNLIIGQDNERERLSRDLHDQMGPHLNALAAIVSSIKTDKPEQDELLKEVKDELWNASQEVRNISHDLMSTSLRKYGLMEAIRKLITRSDHPGLIIEMKSDTEAEELSDLQISNLYNILRELVYNTIKHSDADRAEIEFSSDQMKRKLFFKYSDNGKGSADFDPKKAGIGLSNIRTRVKLMEGEIEIDMKNGFLCRIELNY